jgi:hypothetical protein
MESIYYVLSYVCHRRCEHCYEDRFRPYHGAALGEQIERARAVFPRIIDHLPQRLGYLDRTTRQPDGSPRERAGRIILAGGEALHPAVREVITYPAIERLVARYRGQGVRIIVQTTGDLLSDEIVAALVTRGIHMISVAGFDAYHVGIDTPAAQDRLRGRLTELFDRHGLRPTGHGAAAGLSWIEEDGPTYGFFGATPDSWIGKIWPRGRAWHNGLSRATLADNFCAAWSGGRGFLDYGYEGSEVSIDPGGDVYPCCLKTRRPIGNLVEEPLLDILQSLADDPVFQAINAGRPQGMGPPLGISDSEFLDLCRTQTPAGLPYQNLCIGCDRVFEEKLGPRLAALRALRAERRGQRPPPGTESPTPPHRLPPEGPQHG